MEKIFKIYLLITCLLCFERIDAINENDMNYYSNDLGVTLSEKEYIFISKMYSYNKSSKEGRGFSIVLPNASNIKVSASIYTSKNGKVYGTYQHAKEKTDLNTSKLYNFNSSGSGKVMLFYGKALGKYDDINGLNVNV